MNPAAIPARTGRSRILATSIVPMNISDVDSAHYYLAASTHFAHNGGKNRVTAAFRAAHR
jgi:hypothetical protein